MSRLFLPLFFVLLLVLGTPYSFAQNKEGVLSHDSLMSLNEEAFTLVFSDINKADSIVELVYNIALYQNDSIAIARAVSIKGSINWAYAKYNLSLKWYFNSLARYEILKDTLGVIKNYNNIAEVYKKLKYNENSLHYLHLARNVIKTYSKIESSVLNNLNIAQIFINMNENDSASFYLNLAKKAPEKEVSLKMISFLNYLYAKLNKNQGRFEEAIVYLEQSIHFANLANNVVRQADAYLLLGELYLSVNNLDKAKLELTKALEIAQKFGYEHIELGVYKTLYQIAVKEGDSTQAFNNLLNYSELKDTIYNLSVSRQAAEFETVYQLEKMEKENSLLQQKHDDNSNIIKYQIAFIMAAIFALFIAIYFLLIVNKQRKSLKVALTELEVKSKLVEAQKHKLEKQSQTTDLLNKELTLLNKNLDSRAQQIAREMEVKNKKMNKYAFMNAHKLRAPIASILGLINLFGKDITTQDEKAMIRMLKESAHKLDNVVHEIKDVIDG